jgi:SAM-dependent methyltransferase
MRSGATTDQRRLGDAAYEGKEEFFGIEPSELGRRALHIFQEEGMKDILELGCGQGRDTMLFLQKGFSVVAMDYTVIGVILAKEKGGQEGADHCLVLQRTDIRKAIRLGNESVDAILSPVSLHGAEREGARGHHERVPLSAETGRSGYLLGAERLRPPFRNGRPLRRG